MKKIILIVNLLLVCAGLTFGHTAPKKDTAKTKSAKTATAGPTKKDGTADMRYKANKDAAKAKPAGPTKKDGTPDMRYKANKAAKADSAKKH